MKTIEKVITPHDKPIYEIFSKQQSYFIDIYQREYRWERDNVETLLNDIELRFQINDRKKKEPKEIQQDVQENFEPYFLNSFLINKTAKDTFIVDGQQRLTVLLLIFIKFYHIVDQINKSANGKTFDISFIKELIYEKDPFGNPKKFKIYNENREIALKALIDKDEEFSGTDITQKRIFESYKLISKYYDGYFQSEDNKDLIDTVKFNYYVSYVLFKLVIIEVEITQTKNVAMIFEVVNDRGKPLESFEILKGKLMGILEGDYKEKANFVWTEILNNHDANGLNVDDFFKLFLRSKFANSEKDYEKFEKNYHFEIYNNKALRDYFGNFENPDILFKRVVEDLKYFSDANIKVQTTQMHRYVVFNRLNKQNQQNLLVLSSLNCNDKNEDLKIKAVSKKFDQMHVVFRLLNMYDSNTFQDYVYQLNTKLRGVKAEKIYDIFDNLVIPSLEGTFIEKNKYKTIGELLNTDRINGLRNQWLNFTKYILMRFELALSQMLGNKPTFVISDRYEYTHDNSFAYYYLDNIFNLNNRKVAGLHLEHMYAHNEKNYTLFTDGNGIVDYEKFYKVRELIGALLLLKSSHNLSSNNDTYIDKFETYKKSNIIWNEILTGSIQDIDLKQLPKELKFTVQQPDTNGLLPLKAIDDRQREAISLIRYIWNDHFHEDLVL